MGLCLGAQFVPQYVRYFFVQAVDFKAAGSKGTKAEAPLPGHGVPRCGGGRQVEAADTAGDWEEGYGNPERWLGGPQVTHPADTEIFRFISGMMHEPLCCRLTDIHLYTVTHSWLAVQDTRPQR
jgi:hypothetical protein